MNPETITPEVVAAHNLTSEEFGRLRELLGREPTYVELGVFSVMWSEHCSYKSIHHGFHSETGQGCQDSPGLFR